MQTAVDRAARCRRRVYAQVVQGGRRLVSHDHERTPGGGQDASVERDAQIRKPALLRILGRARLCLWLRGLWGRGQCVPGTYVSCRSCHVNEARRRMQWTVRAMCAHSSPVHSE
eukprot:699803-Prymnesium_polylepis.1